MNIKCLCCGKKLECLYDIGDPPEVSMWKKAGVHEFLPGFGSDFDSTEFIVGICDKCIKQKLNEGLLTIDNNQDGYNTENVIGQE